MTYPMGKFTGRPQIQYASKESDILEDDYWRVMDGFRYFVNEKGSKAWVDIPPGYLIDGASVPRPFWNIIPPWGDYGAAAIVHDRLCEYLTLMTPEGPKRITRKRCDQILDEAMQVLGVDDVSRSVIYHAVSAYRIVSGTDQPQLNREKQLLEAAWRKNNGIDPKVEITEPAKAKDVTCADPETQELIAEKDTPEPTVAERLESRKMMFTREWIIRDKTAVEAGYVDHKDDLGGATNKGITEAVATKHEKKLRELFGWDGDMRTLTDEMAMYIYTEDYWRVLHLDAISELEPLLADKLFDIGINAGTARAGMWLQIYLNVANQKGTLYPDLEPDGLVGPMTLGRLKDYLAKRGKKAMPRLLKAMLCKQGAHYMNISEGREANETFFYGWMARLEHNFGLYYDALWTE